MQVAFIDGQVIMWPKGKTIDDAVVIREQEGGPLQQKLDLASNLAPDFSVFFSQLW